MKPVLAAGGKKLREICCQSAANSPGHPRDLDLPSRQIELSRQKYDALERSGSITIVRVKRRAVIRQSCRRSHMARSLALGSIAHLNPRLVQISSSALANCAAAFGADRDLASPAVLWRRSSPANGLVRLRFRTPSWRSASKSSLIGRSCMRSSPSNRVLSVAEAHQRRQKPRRCACIADVQLRLLRGNFAAASDNRDGAIAFLGRIGLDRHFEIRVSGANPPSPACHRPTARRAACTCRRTAPRESARGW